MTLGASHSLNDSTATPNKTVPEKISFFSVKKLVGTNGHLCYPIVHLPKSWSTSPSSLPHAVEPGEENVGHPNGLADSRDICVFSGERTTSNPLR